MNFKNLKLNSLILILLFAFVSCESTNEDDANIDTNSEDIEALEEARMLFGENDDNNDDEDGDSTDDDNNGDNEDENDDNNEDDGNEDEDEEADDEDEDNNDSSDDEDDNEGNGDDSDNDDNNEERDIDCDVFTGIIVIRNGRIAGVQTTRIYDIESVVWRVNGIEVTPRAFSLRFILLSDHVTEAGPVEVSYTAFSETCGEFNETVTVNFPGS